MSDPRRYLVFEHTDGTGCSAWVPDLPDSIAAADSREECEQLIREAIVLHLKGMREDGEPIRAIIRGRGDRKRPCGAAEQR